MATTEPDYPILHFEHVGGVGRLAGRTCRDRDRVLAPAREKGAGALRPRSYAMRWKWHCATGGSMDRSARTRMPSHGCRSSRRADAELPASKVTARRWRRCSPPVACGRPASRPSNRRSRTALGAGLRFRPSRATVPDDFAAALAADPEARAFFDGLFGRQPLRDALPDPVGRSAGDVGAADRAVRRDAAAGRDDSLNGRGGTDLDRVADGCSPCAVRRRRDVRRSRMKEDEPVARARP